MAEVCSIMSIAFIVFVLLIPPIYGGSPSPPKPTKRIEFTTITSKIDGADTDSVVRLEIQMNGGVVFHYLDSDRDDFERGQTDSFSLQTTDYGRISRFCMRTNEYYRAWLPRRACLTDVKLNEFFWCDFNRHTWLEYHKYTCCYNPYSRGDLDYIACLYY